MGVFANVLDKPLGEALKTVRVTRFEFVDTKKLRKNLNVSRRDFADAIDVSLETVKSWEQGRRNPTGSTHKLLKLIVDDPSVYERLTSIQ